MSFRGSNDIGRLSLTRELSPLIRIINIMPQLILVINITSDQLNTSQPDVQFRRIDKFKNRNLFSSLHGCSNNTFS